MSIHHPSSSSRWALYQLMPLFTKVGKYFPFLFSLETIFTGFFSFTYITCVVTMKQPYASYFRKRAVFLVWTPNLAALMFIKPGLRIRGSAVTAHWCIHAFYLYAWSFAHCFFLIVLIVFIFPSFNHKRWTGMNGFVVSSWRHFCPQE